MHTMCVCVYRSINQVHIYGSIPVTILLNHSTNYSSCLHPGTLPLLPKKFYYDLVIKEI